MGQLTFTPKRSLVVYRQPKQLGDAYDTTKVVATTATAVAAVASTAVASGAIAAGATLFTVAGAAVTVPVIGWIAGAIVAIAAVLLTVFGKSKARKAEAKAINEQTNQLKQEAMYLDAERQKIQTGMIEAKNKLILMGYGDVVKNNPITVPLNGAKEDLARAKKTNEEWRTTLEQKGKLLEQDQKTLQSWYDALTGAKKQEKILIATGIGALLLTTLMLLPAATKSKSKTKQIN
jgi:membrane protein implicated in regulation of membrane protease activity